MKKLLYIVLCAIVAMAAVSCEDEYRDLEFGLDTETIDAEIKGDSYQVIVTTSFEWTAVVNDAANNPWIQLYQAQGVGPANLWIVVSTNLKEEPRTAIVTVNAEGTNKTITVTQKASTGTVPGATVNNVTFDHIISASYYGDEYLVGTGYQNFVFINGDVDAFGNLTGAGWRLSLDTYTEMMPDPERAFVFPGEYVSGTFDQGTPLTFLMDDSSSNIGTYIDRYDANGTVTRFDINDGIFTVTYAGTAYHGGEFTIEGKFLNTEGDEVVWDYTGKTLLANTRHLLTDANGYMVYREKDIVGLSYLGDYDFTGAGVLVFDNRHMGTALGTYLELFIDNLDQADPDNIQIATGEYNVNDSGQKMSVKPGYAEDGVMYGSYEYRSDGARVVTAALEGGTITISRYAYDPGLYDILFDPIVNDGWGNSSEGRKIRFIGSIAPPNNSPTTIEWTAIDEFCSINYLGTSSNGTDSGLFRLMLGTAASWTGDTELVYLDFYGSDFGTSGNYTGNPEVEAGTYTISRSQEKFTAFPGHIPSWSAAGTFIYRFAQSSSGITREAYLGTKGTIVITKKPNGEYLVETNFLAVENATAGRQIHSKVTFEGPIVFNLYP